MEVTGAVNGPNSAHTLVTQLPGHPVLLSISGASVVLQDAGVVVASCEVEGCPGFAVATASASGELIAAGGSAIDTD